MCAEVENGKSSESALLISTVSRRRLCRRSREGYGGGGSFGRTFRVPSVTDTIATGGSGDMALGSGINKAEFEFEQMWERKGGRTTVVLHSEKRDHVKIVGVP